MFTAPNEQDKQVSSNQISEAKTAREQQSEVLDLAKIQREFFRIVGMVLAAAGVNADPWTIEVQKARLFEAIVEQHKSDIEKELGIKLSVWAHGTDLQRYAAEQGYLGDASHMSKIEGQLRTRALQGPKLALRMSPQTAVTSPVAEERKEAAEVVVQRPAETPQAQGFKKPTALDYPKILEFMEEYRKSELAKLDSGDETAKAVVRHLAEYEKIEENIRVMVAKQQ
jgi:hypothetical protein